MEDICQPKLIATSSTKLRARMCRQNAVTDATDAANDENVLNEVSHDGVSISKNSVVRPCLSRSKTENCSKTPPVVSIKKNQERTLIRCHTANIKNNPEQENHISENKYQRKLRTRSSIPRKTKSDTIRNEIQSNTQSRKSHHRFLSKQASLPETSSRQTDKQKTDKLQATVCVLEFSSKTKTRQKAEKCRSATSFHLRPRLLKQHSMPEKPSQHDHYDNYLAEKNDEVDYLPHHQRSLKEGRRLARSTSTIAYPEVITMVSQISPVMSDVETKEPILHQAIPVNDTPKMMMRSNYGTVIQRPAFLTRSSSLVLPQLGPCQTSRHINQSENEPKTEVVGAEVYETNESNDITTQESKPVNDEQLITAADFPVMQEIALQPKESTSKNAFELPGNEVTTNMLSYKNEYKPKNKSNSPMYHLAQEKECSSMYYKLHKNGINISLQTLQRALLTPAEYHWIKNLDRTSHT